MRRYAAPALLLALSACAALPPRPAEHRPVRAGRQGLINPLLDLAPGSDLAELRPFEHEVRELIADRRRDAKVTHVSVFWQDLDNGQSFNIDAAEKFAPASLLKVPVLIAVLKMAQEDPGLLGRRVTYAPQERILPSAFQPQGPSLERGREYPVDRLIDAMIVESDNGAALTLLSLVGPERMDRIYRDFGFSIPDVRAPLDSTTVREYAAFFRILYNASYLDRERSEAALEHLARSRFVRGLVAGVPAGTVVPHKFGIREVQGVRQLHDCGIVYRPGEPYVLCVMTRGADYDALVETIASVSRLVYSEVDAQAAKPR